MPMLLKIKELQANAQAKESKLINSGRIEVIKKEVNEIISIVVASIKTARENENRKSINQKS